MFSFLPQEKEKIILICSHTQYLIQSFFEYDNREIGRIKLLISRKRSNVNYRNLLMHSLFHLYIHIFTKVVPSICQINHTRIQNEFFNE